MVNSYLDEGVGAFISEDEFVSEFGLARAKSCGDDPALRIGALWVSPASVGP